MNVEGADLIYLAAGFAERLADGDWEEALLWAQAADGVSRGAFLVAERPDGECRAITRRNTYCETLPAPASPTAPFTPATSGRIRPMLEHREEQDERANRLIVLACPACGTGVLVLPLPAPRSSGAPSAAPPPGSSGCRDPGRWSDLLGDQVPSIEWPS
jgi:hypothetical protein